MPQNRTTSKAAHQPASEASKEKVAAVVGEMTEEERESIIRDFQIQGEAMITQACKKFEAEAKLLISALPDKSSLPKELVNMPIEEFIRRGGTISAVMESLKKEKLRATETVLESNVGATATGATSCTSGEELKSGPSDPAFEFVTPAVTTRSQAVTGMDTGNVTKRRPKPLEHVNVTAWSQVSGSPVDEQTFLQLKMAAYADTLERQVLQETVQVSMPKKWRSHFIKSIQKVKSQAITSQMEFVTPMVHRTKKNEK